jgi:glutamate synthase (NADPH/NADH) small chain
MGAGQPRDLNVPGRDNANIMFAWDFLTTQNKLCSGEPVDSDSVPNAKDKVVVVIGGGDTGSDCVGTSRRQGAKQIIQLEILPKPPQEIPVDTPWPMWPRIMRTSTSHEEGCDRRWSVMTKSFDAADGKVTALHGCEVQWLQTDGKWQMKELPGTDFVIKADLVLLAMGYVHVVHKGIVADMGLKLDDRGNIVVNNYQSSEDWVFAAGDTVLGASLVVRAIAQGREAADAIDSWLTH